MRRTAVAAALAIVCAGPAAGRGAVFPAEGHPHGAVAADHPLAAEAGVSILQAGGNAVDAACATAFVLGVVNPSGSGIGGGGFLLYRPPSGTAVALDFRETAPAAASRDMFSATARDASRVGGLAVAVPGEVLGCATAVKDYGKLPLRRVLRPAIRLARRGFPAGPHLVQTIRGQESKLRERPELARIFLPRGRPPAPGQRLKRPRLARALGAIARHGPRAFYRGWIARDIASAVRSAGGIMTVGDLASYRIKRRTPIESRYRAFTVLGMPPPSSGGVAIAQALNILGGLDVRDMGHGSSRQLHVVAEALKHAFADRARYLGDPDFAEVPVERLTSPAYAAELRRRIGDKVQPLESYGSPAAPREPTGGRAGTSHISVVDAHGGAAALTTTINTAFGALVVAPRSGIILNNEMDDFAARPGRANLFGLVQGESNAVQPNKRPLSSMAPTIVLRDEQVALAVGASGGPTIISGTLQVLINVVDFRLEPRAAVSHPRIHHQWRPNALMVEAEVALDVTDALRARGHTVLVWPESFTAVQLVTVDDELRYGVADPRKLGRAAGY